MGMIPITQSRVKLLAGVDERGVYGTAPSWKFYWAIIRTVGGNYRLEEKLVRDDGEPIVQRNGKLRRTRDKVSKYRAMTMIEDEILFHLAGDMWYSIFGSVREWEASRPWNGDSGPCEAQGEVEITEVDPVSALPEDGLELTVEP
jgi:hypothetical protein